MMRNAAKKSPLFEFLADFTEPKRAAWAIAVSIVLFVVGAGWPRV